MVAPGKLRPWSKLMSSICGRECGHGKEHLSGSQETPPHLHVTCCVTLSGLSFPTGAIPRAVPALYLSRNSKAENDAWAQQLLLSGWGEIHWLPLYSHARPVPSIESGKWNPRWGEIHGEQALWETGGRAWTELLTSAAGRDTSRAEGTFCARPASRSYGGLGQSPE